MRLINFLKNLNWNFWGIVASILSIPLAIVLYWATPTGAGGDTINVNSSQQRGGITANQVNINPSVVNVNPPVKEQSYVLRNVKYGATAVMDSPNLANLFGKDASKHVVCLAPAGTPVTLTGRTEKMGGLDNWQEVTVTAGDCANRVGWVAKENLHWEQ